MADNDTIRMLRECDAGVKMGISSLNEVIPDVKNGNMKARLNECLGEHNQLDATIQRALASRCDEGKNPNPAVKAMSWMKTEMKIALDRSDGTIAELMTDGCNMGVKSLSRYLNQYPAADEETKGLAKKLIASEERLSVDLRQYL